MSTLSVEVIDIKGSCPVYKKGDTFYILDGYKLTTNLPKRSQRSKRTQRSKRYFCMHSLSSIMPYYVALSKGISPKDLGLSKEDGVAYVQCLDPCEYTSGGTVIFRITFIDKDKNENN